MTQASEDPVSIVPGSGRWAETLAGGLDAFRELAGSYWYCVYAWWRRTGRSAEESVLATEGTFARWLTTEPPQPTDPAAARMREWMLVRLAGLIEKTLEEGEARLLGIDGEWAEKRYTEEPAGEADVIFQRRWALTILEFAVSQLSAKYAAVGEESLVAELLPFAGFAQQSEEAYADAAARAGRSEAAMRKAVYEFRIRQRALLRALAADTLADAADLESEMSALLIACDALGANMAGAPLPQALGAVLPDQMLARAMNTVRISAAGDGRGWAPPTVEEVAGLFPQYELISMVGHGGMGAVYQARQTSLDRLVAIKLLPLEVSVDREFADRFRREARAMAKLNHPNIISVYDFGQTREGHLYIVMEFVDGPMLQELIHGRAPLPVADALSLVEQVCEALAYAHEKGVVHRDIKPANVMVTREGRAKVADFGLARLTEPGTTSWGTTMTGVVMGTPDYMAPEQKRGHQIDHRVDIYALGVVLYEALCKETPQGAFELPSKRCGTDRRLDAVITKALASRPEDRYQTTTELRTAIATIRPAVAKAEAKSAHSAGAATPRPRVPTTPGLVEPEPRGRFALYAGLTVGTMIFVALALYFLPPNLRPTTGQHATAAALPTAAPQPVDLLALVDPEQDKIDGHWERRGRELLGEGPFAKLAIRYVAPAEYDFRIRFTRHGGQAVTQHIVHGGRDVMWMMGGFNNSVCGLEQLNNVKLRDSAEAVRLGLEDERSYESVVRVRHGRVQAELDGKLLVDRATDGRDFTMFQNWRFPDPTQLGVGCQGPTTFHELTLLPVSTEPAEKKR